MYSNITGIQKCISELTGNKLKIICQHSLVHFTPFFVVYRLGQIYAACDKSSIPQWNQVKKLSTFCAHGNSSLLACSQADIPDSQNICGFAFSFPLATFFVPFDAIRSLSRVQIALVFPRLIILTHGLLNCKIMLWLTVTLWVQNECSKFALYRLQPSTCRCTDRT